MAQAAPAPGTYTVTVAHSGKCLDIANASAANGAVLVQNTCNGSPSQRFTVGKYANADTNFIRTFAGKCLTRDPWSETAVSVTQWGCIHNHSQQLQFTAYHPWQGEAINTLDWKGNPDSASTYTTPPPATAPTS
ncbi:RICIN domain-containing protein [Streptomyces sp. NBC_00690]